jgi:hypothetical protein
MGAGIGTGSHIARRVCDRTPARAWTATGEHENYGVPPDVLIDNTPDFVKGRDAQVEGRQS